VYSEDALEKRLKIYKKAKVKIKEIKDNGNVIFDEDSKDNISEQFSKEDLLKIFEKVNLKVNEIKRVDIAYLCKLSK
jgi:thymidylate synthase